MDSIWTISKLPKVETVSLLGISAAPKDEMVSLRTISTLPKYEMESISWSGAMEMDWKNDFL